MHRIATATLVALIFVGCGSDTPEPRTVPTIAFPAGPTAQDAQRWAANWCKVKMTDTRADLVRKMGEPTETQLASWEWTGFGYQFIAFFDEYGKLTQLDTNEIQMSPAQKARVRCADVRTVN